MTDKDMQTKHTIRLLDAVSWFGLLLGFSLADFEHIIYIIIGLISLLTTVVSGVVSIVIKIKKAAADGKITDEEIEDIKGSINDFKEEVDKYHERKDRTN